MAASLVVVPVTVATEIASTSPAAVETWLPDLVPGLALLACGVAALLAARRVETAWALIAAGVLWFAANVATAVQGGAGDVLAFLTYGHRGLVVASLLLLAPRRAAWMGACAAVASTLITPLMTEPDLMLLWATFVLLGGGLAAWSARGPGWIRAVTGYAVVASTVAVVACISRYTDPNQAPAFAVAAYQAGMTTAAVAVLVAALAYRARSATVTDAVVGLAMGSAGTVQAQLTHALRDSELDLAFATPGGWIDETGRSRGPVRQGPGRERIPVQVDGIVVAELSCRADVASARQVVTSIGSATRLAARNAALRAALRAEADRLRTSRRRLLLVEDEARRGLAARLRAGIDGPLDELTTSAASVSNSVALGAAASRCRERPQALRAEFDRLAAGLGPSALETGDLCQSLKRLGEATGLDVSCIVTDAALPREVATTVYLVCAEAIANVGKHALARSLELRVEVDQTHLIVAVSDDGIGGADAAAGTGLRGLAHRVTALGGTLELTSPPGSGTQLVATLDTATAC